VNETQLDAPLGHATVPGQRLAQQPLGLVLRQGREAVGHVGWQREVDRGDLLAVAVHELTTDRERGVEDRREHACRLPELQRARLHPDGLGVLRRFGHLVHDTASHPAPTQLQRRRQADGSGSDDEHVDVDLPRSARHDALVSIGRRAAGGPLVQPLLGRMDSDITLFGSRD